jgi:hypothetical protein
VGHLVRPEGCLSNLQHRENVGGIGDRKDFHAWKFTQTGDGADVPPPFLPPSHHRWCSIFQILGMATVTIGNIVYLQYYFISKKVV